MENGNEISTFVHIQHACTHTHPAHRNDGEKRNFDTKNQ